MPHETNSDVLLLTGASSDLGLALVRRLLARPEPPLVLAHVSSGGERVQALRDELHTDLLQTVQADFTSADAVAAMADRIAAEHGAPSQVVHLPGLKLRYERFPKFDWDHFQRDLAVQLQSAIVLLQRFLPKMAKMPRARVVFVLSSVTRGLPPKFMSMYTIVKHAQLGLMKALAAEYAGTGVTVNAVSPSMVATRFLESLPEVAVQMAASSSPRGRHATPDEVVGAIAFLLSPEADYVSGAELPVTAAGTA
jgi:3-oxoacyl-[acyl-carrier protein] reductase